MGFRSEDVQEYVSLAAKTTIGLGGPARFYYRVTDNESLYAAVLWARCREVPIFVLGGGSNSLIADSGFPGLVLELAQQGTTWQAEGERVRVWAAAGEIWDELVAASVAHNLAGIECLSGIPGRVGAAPIQNIGAYGQEVAQVLDKVWVMDLVGGSIKALAANACGFGYRTSIFKHGPMAKRYIVLAIELLLESGGGATLNYPDLRNRLRSGAGLSEVRATVLAVRREKSMVYDREDPNSWGCGSFFTNPILDQPGYAAFQERVGGDHPHYPGGPGLVKLSAAWLIQNAGFDKGYGTGPVGLSDKHCLAIVHRGGGSTREVLALAEQLKAGVLARFGVHLEPEPVMVQ